MKMLKKRRDMLARKILFVLGLSFCHLLPGKLAVTDYAQITGFSESEIIQALKVIEQIDHEEPYHSLFADLINRLGLSIGCEVGILTGAHCKYLLEHTKVDKLYGIDPFIDYQDPATTPLPQKYFDILYWRVKLQFSLFGSRFELLRDTSLNAVDHFKERELDFVFIDANHNYGYVIADLRAWYPKIRGGGIIAGDDYATVWPGVPQAINQFCAENNLKVNVHPLQPRFWWIEKPILCTGDTCSTQD